MVATYVLVVKVVVVVALIVLMVVTEVAVAVAVAALVVMLSSRPMVKYRPPHVAVLVEKMVVLVVDS